jgi:hypothetical protein
MSQYSISLLQPTSPNPIGGLAPRSLGRQWPLRNPYTGKLSFTSFSRDLNDQDLSAKDVEEIKLREATTQLMSDHHAYPPGSLTPELIQDAEEALEFWVFERDRSGFQNASNLLKRLVLEQEHLGKSAPPRVESNDDSNHSIYHVRTFLLNQVVDCWRTCWRDQKLDISPTDMLSIVDEYETRGLLPDNRTFTLIVDGMILRGDPFEAPLLAQWLFDRRMDQIEDDPERRPDTVFITNVIRAWAKSGRVEAPEMAEQLLTLMEGLYEKGWTHSAPNELSYGVVLEAWSKSRDRDANNRIEALLESMKTSRYATPDRVSYMYALNGWANARTPGASQKAYSILQEMLALYKEGNEYVKPDQSNFTKVMVALAHQGDLGRVEEVFQQLQDMYVRTGEPAFKPNAECSKARVIALAKGGSPSEAQSIMYDMVDRAVATNNPGLMPKRSYFIDVLVAWTKQRNQKMGSEFAEKLLLRMLDLSKSGYPELMPDAKSFEKVMHCWSTSRLDSAAKQVESLLSLMDQVYKDTRNERLKPSGRSFELAISTWSRSGQQHAPDRANAIMSEMEKRYAAGDRRLRPSRGAYTSLMLTNLRSRRQDSHVTVQKIFDTLQSRYKDGESDLRPDLFVYSILMDTWAARGDPEKTQAIFDDMLKSYEEGNEEAKPDAHAFNKLLKAWVNSSNCNKAVKAEETLQHMRDLGISPDRQTFNEMILAWSKSSRPDAAERAESYLQRLKENRFEPSLLSYRAVIDAWSKSSKSDAVVRAETILEEFLADTKLRRSRPPLYKPYRNFLQSIARSKIPGRNAQAKELLRTLPNGKVHPELLPPLN